MAVCEAAAGQIQTQSARSITSSHLKPNWTTLRELCEAKKHNMRITFKRIHSYIAVDEMIVPGNVQNSWFDALRHQSIGIYLLI